MSDFLVAALFVALLGAAGCGAAGGRVLLATNFETDPTQSGWTIGGYPNQKPAGAWIDTTSVSGRHALRADEGWWSSPRLTVRPQQYYRLRFSAAVEGKGYWWVQFFDAQGRPHPSDHYSSVYPSDEWRRYEFCFRARSDAAGAEVRFQAIAAPLLVDDVRVETLSRREVARWADRMYAQVPPVDLKPVPRPGKRLARSMARLREGKVLRIVMLGDSIINDIGNSFWDVLVERMYPKARVEIVHSVGGGKGCPFYRQDNRVKAYVLDRKGDLLIIGGISNGDDPESVRDVIRQVRAKSDPDILVMSGAVSTRDDFLLYIAKWPKDKQADAIRRARAYRPGLKKMAREEKVEYFDLRAHWDAYVGRIRKPPEWLRRDRPHCNNRARMVIARLLSAYFSPPR